MSDNKLNRSLEDLFSDFPPPEPEGRERPLRPPRVEPPPGPEAGQAPVVEEETQPRFTPHGMTIRGRLMWGFVAILVLLLLSGVANFLALNWLDRAFAELQREGERVTAAYVAARASADLLLTIGQASPSQDPDTLVEALGRSRSDLSDAIGGLSTATNDLPDDDEVRVEARRAQSRMSGIDFIADYVATAVREGNWERVSFYQAQLEVNYDLVVVQSLGSMIVAAEERQAAAAAQMTAARRLINFAPTVFGVLALVVAALTSLITIRGIARPVDRLVEGATRLAAGRLEERVPVERRDEFGRLAVAFNEMAEHLQDLYAELEDRVAERTRALQDANYALQRRAMQLEASAQIGRTIASIFDIDQLLRRTVELIRDQFGFYHAGIFLLDETGEWAVLREATGEAGAKMKAQGHRLAVGGSSMVGWTAQHRQSRIALDVGEDAVHFANPLLPYTRSEVTLPLISGGRLLGVLNVQSTEEAAFDSDDVRSLQSMADQIAVAIDNARRLSEEGALLEATSPVYRLGRRLTTAVSLDDVLDVVLSSVMETDADGCVLGLFEPYGEEPVEVEMSRVWARDHRFALKPGTRVPVGADGEIVESHAVRWVASDLDEADKLPRQTRPFVERVGGRAVANFPLAAGDRPTGFLFVYRTTPGAFSGSSLRLYETLSDQAAVALERVRLLAFARRRAEEEATLRAVGDRLSWSMDMRAVMRGAAEELGQALRADGVYIELGTLSSDDEGGEEQ